MQGGAKINKYVIGIVKAVPYFIKCTREGLFLVAGFIIIFLSTVDLKAQTPGLIIEPADATGSLVMDPNGDGFVSFYSSGFVSDDVAESEIPYATLVASDPEADPLAGPNYAHNDILGTDAPNVGNSAVMIYYDGTNLLFRFRLGNYSSSSAGYSVLFDSDSKFGFTGPNADPDAVSGNPGFEFEILLRSNFEVELWDVDGGFSTGTFALVYFSV